MHFRFDVAIWLAGIVFMAGMFYGRYEYKSFVQERLTTVESKLQLLLDYFKITEKPLPNVTSIQRDT